MISGRYSAWFNRREKGWLIDRVAPDCLWRCGPPFVNRPGPRLSVRTYRPLTLSGLCRGAGR